MSREISVQRLLTIFSRFNFSSPLTIGNQDRKSAFSSPVHLIQQGIWFFLHPRNMLSGKFFHSSVVVIKKSTNLVGIEEKYRRTVSRIGSSAGSKASLFVMHCLEVCSFDSEMAHEY